MKALFKDLYRQYLEKGVSPTDFGQFKEELNHIPDEELWNVMIDMEKDATTEIGMPPMMKKTDTKRNASDYLETALDTDYQICCCNRPACDFFSRRLFFIEYPGNTTNDNCQCKIGQ